jgi:hypothetical protein
MGEGRRGDEHLRAPADTAEEVHEIKVSPQRPERRISPQSAESRVSPQRTQRTQRKRRVKESGERRVRELGAP